MPCVVLNMALTLTPIGILALVGAVSIFYVGIVVGWHFKKH
jgi:hypothetical protein